MDRKIPTPSISYFEIGPFVIHFYAICIILGILIAIEITKRRYSKPNQINDLAFYAIIFGLIGARIYHVLTSFQIYQNGNWLAAFKIWEGGLGIWGAIAGGAIAIFVRTRKLGLSFLEIADAAAPGILIAQGIGRFGNWFNAELFGKPTNLPWGLFIPKSDRPIEYLRFSYFHPTFLYEAICSFLFAFLLLRLKLKSGAIFALYIFGYCSYRFFIEGLRIDPANLFFGLRLNQVTSLAVGAAGFTFFLLAIR